MNNLRQLNESEKGLALTVSAAVHYLIRRMDDLKSTSLYSQKVKQTGNMFQKELEKHSKAQVWEGEVEGVDINAAADQMESLTDLFHNLLVLAMGCSEVPPGQQELFWIELQKNFKRFGIPLRMRPDGVLEFCEQQGKMAVAA